MDSACVERFMEPSEGKSDLPGPHEKELNLSQNSGYAAIETVCFSILHTKLDEIKSCGHGQIE